MKFKIGEISRLTGFSTSGIRFFEEAGVINPVRGKNEKYREFSLEDLQRLLICRKFRECGFSLEQSVDMLHHADAQELRSHILKQAECTRRHLVEKQALLEHLNEQIKDIDHMVEEESCCHITQMPALYWLKLWQPGDHEEDLIPFTQMYEWIERGPFTNSCLLLPQADLLKGEGNLETRWGTAINEKYVEMLGFSPQAQTQYLPACEAVRTIISPTNSLTIPAEQLRDFRDFIKKMGLKVTGPALSRFFYSRITGGHLLRYDHLWVPVNRS
jgi:DNA-binding transcriptional MerR regulator